MVYMLRCIEFKRSIIRIKIGKISDRHILELYTINEFMNQISYA